MSYSFKSLNITKLSVIGAGQIGPDIALHFAKVLTKNNVNIVLIDISEDALANAKAKIEKKIGKGVETRAFKQEFADKMNASILYTTKYENIAGSQIVLEAATEDERIKDLIFKQVEKICDDKCLFFSNSSHMQPEVIFKNIADNSRCLVTHYFFPAEKNPIVELIPSNKTNPEIIDLLLGFYEDIGKVPVKVKSSYGYAVDPIFEGLCQAAILCLEKGYGTVKEIDKVAMETLGQGVGPFTALNLTGGNPITNHGLDKMTSQLMPWFMSPKSLREAVANNQPWPTAKRDEEVTVSDVKRKVLADQFMGAYFALTTYIMDLAIIDLSDLEMACQVGLVINAPFDMMNRTGLKESLRLVEKYCAEHTEFNVPQSLRDAASRGKWEIHDVIKQVKDNVAVLTIRRPQVLNALNTSVMAEIQSYLQKIESDSTIMGTVLTGFGTKAFVSGADINMLAKLKTPEDGYNNSQTFHKVLNVIENLTKPVVCAMNGFAFGGGNELALACTTRICKKGLPVVACQPEVNLGFIPGAGGTQRLPRLVGLHKGAEILRSARTVSADEALEIGLVHATVASDLIQEGIKLIGHIVSGEVAMKTISKEPMSYIEDPQPIDIGHHSRKIDEIMIKAVYKGASMHLAEALDMESRLFGECIETKDMKIGLNTFLTQGAKAKAEFVHS